MTTTCGVRRGGRTLCLNLGVSRERSMCVHEHLREVVHCEEHMQKLRRGAVECQLCSDAEHCCTLRLLESVPA